MTDLPDYRVVLVNPDDQTERVFLVVENWLPDATTQTTTGQAPAAGAETETTVTVTVRDLRKAVPAGILDMTEAPRFLEGAGVERLLREMGYLS